MMEPRDTHTSSISEAARWDPQTKLTLSSFVCLRLLLGYSEGRNVGKKKRNLVYIFLTYWLECDMFDDLTGQ